MIPRTFLQVRLAKERKKGDKIVSDSQERAYWRVARPPPGVASALEPCPVPVRARHHRAKKRTIHQLTREVPTEETFSLCLSHPRGRQWTSANTVRFSKL